MLFAIIASESDFDNNFNKSEWYITSKMTILDAGLNPWLIFQRRIFSKSSSNVLSFILLVVIYCIDSGF